MAPSPATPERACLSGGKIVRAVVSESDAVESKIKSAAGFRLTLVIAGNFARQC
jgi:hypothetical protein